MVLDGGRVASLDGPLNGCIHAGRDKRDVGFSPVACLWSLEASTQLDPRITPCPHVWT